MQVFREINTKIDSDNLMLDIFKLEKTIVDVLDNNEQYKIVIAETVDEENTKMVAI